MTPDDEARLLGPWLAAYARRFGAAPLLRRDAHGLLLRFPAHAAREHLPALGRVDVFGGHPRVRDHLRRMGFTWDDGDRLTGAPAPASVPARLRALGRPDGPRPRYYLTVSSAINLRTWLEGCMRGELPLALGTSAYYAALRLAARLPERARAREDRDNHFLGVQHDLTKHLALAHLVPRPLLLDLGRALAGGLRAWHRGPLLAAPLVRFYENDLLAYCQQIWRDLADPDRFVDVFTAPANLAQLWDAVRRRLAETAAGPRAWRGADTCPRFQVAYAAPAGSAP